MQKAIRVPVSAILLLTVGLAISFSASAQDVPKQLQPPAGEKLLLQVHAKGDQVYTCKAAEGGQFAWALKGPDAQLFDKDGKPFGKHFAGPSWQANDGSLVIGKAVGNVPSPDPSSIPWLLLTVVSRNGEGALERVTYIQRIDTTGGIAPISGCEAGKAGQEFRASYAADYLFFAPER